MVETTFDIPALLAKSPASETSSRYRFISSQQIVDTLSDQGWEPRQAFYRKSRVVSPLHARHCIRFSNESIGGNAESTPEIVVYNSHDGKSAAQMISGIFRMICSNGMTIMDEEYERFIIPHRGYKAGQKYIDHAIDVLSVQAERSFGMIDKWKKKPLNETIRNCFYRDAIQTRFPNSERGDEWVFDIAQRTSDRGHDLWSVFNRCQEYLEGGGFSVTHSAGKKPRLSRGITNIEATKKLNDDLWVIGTEYYNSPHTNNLHLLN